MKNSIIILLFCGIGLKTNAQFFKKLKSKVDQSVTDVRTKVEGKAESLPDRVIDHTAKKVDNKAEGKIDKKESKTNGKIDKTVDKVDSIKIKKAKLKEGKDSTQNKTG